MPDGYRPWDAVLATAAYNLLMVTVWTRAETQWIIDVCTRSKVVHTIDVCFSRLLGPVMAVNWCSYLI